MDCVSCVVSPEISPQTLRCNLFSLKRISWTNEVPPTSDCILVYELNSSDIIACNKAHQVVIEGFALVFSIEVASCLGRELGNLKFTNDEAILVNSVNDLSSLCIRIWLDHSESFLSVVLKLLPGE